MKLNKCCKKRNIIFQDHEAKCCTCGTVIGDFEDTFRYMESHEQRCLVDDYIDDIVNRFVKIKLKEQECKDIKSEEIDNG